MATAPYAPFTINVNLEEVPTWDGKDYPLVPVGTYAVKIVNVTNDKQLKVEFEIVEGEHASSKLFGNYNPGHEVGLKRLKCLMVACGAPLGEFNSDHLMDCTILVDVIHNQGKGQVQPDGTVKGGDKTFANVVNERALEPAEEQQEAEPEPPPITKANKAPKSGGARRT